MRIEVIKENDVLPKGTVCDVIRRLPFSREYEVWYCSAAGTYKMRIRKEYVEVLKGKSSFEKMMDTIMEARDKEIKKSLNGYQA